MKPTTKDTRKMSKSELKKIVDDAKKTYVAYDSQLPERIKAWCLINFNPANEDRIERVFEEILDASSSGSGSDYAMEASNAIIEKHNEIRSATR